MPAGGKGRGPRQPKRGGAGSGGGGGGGGARSTAVRVKTARGRKLSSTKWLQRQLNDPYVSEAKRQGYASRAAFKLIEIDDKARILKPGQRVVDLGAAPGGWTQVAVDRVRAGQPGGGQVVAIDRLEMDKIPDAIRLQGDFLDEAAVQAVRTALSGPVDVVLSDLSPSTTGHPATDHLRIMALVEAALDFAEEVLAPGGSFIAKVFQGGTENDILQRLRRLFRSVKHVKPPASRKESAEQYVVATGFRPAESGSRDDD